jgi:CxxC-x17-CxxC domain-containing protein
MKDFKRSNSFGDKKRGDFDRRDSGDRGFNRGGFGRGGSDSARPAMHTAICAECGNSCEVPFKPSGDRPVYCSNCFKGKKDSFTPQRPDSRDFSKPRFESPTRPSAPTNSGAPSNEQFVKLNAKLDKILSILDSISIEEEDYDDNEDVAELPQPPKDTKKAKATPSKKSEVKKSKKSKKK